MHRGVGGITENDIETATAGCDHRLRRAADRKARDLADAEKVEIRTYEIIYHLLEDIESAMVGLLAPEFEEVVTGDAEVREIFSVPRIGKIAGCYVLNGVVTRNSKVRFIRKARSSGRPRSVAQALRDDAGEVAAGTSTASACRTSRICAPATSLRPTRSARSSAPRTSTADGQGRPAGRSALRARTAKRAS